MADAVLRFTALVVAVCGMAWLALALDAHWQAVQGGEAPTRGTRQALRALGAAALVGSLGLHFWLDHRSMAPLVWVMALAASSLLVALTLAFRPRWLSFFVFWHPKRATDPADESS